jgi:eukaryotic-like serine/threonine-protein kinase
VEVREREFSLLKAGKVVPVEPKAFRVLLILLRNPQKLLPKDELLNAVWGDTAVSENSLAHSIALLRRLLGDEGRTPRFIETVATVGYRCVCAVQSEEDSVATPEAVSSAAVRERRRRAA